ncbi:MAG: phosphatase PAP2 family protein [Nitrospirae bacterium]|nr:phosphatase PAP2 family protein [Nitrospirota bacterium]
MSVSSGRLVRQLASLAIFIAILVVFSLGADKWTIDSIKLFLLEHGTLNIILRKIDPICNFLYHGATQITAAFILFITGKYLYRPLYRVGRMFFYTLCASGLTVQIIKHLVGRARPRITDSFIAIGPSLHVDYDSFPSGHTALAFSIACILSSYFKRYSVIFYSFAVLAGFDRVKAGSHFPSDVIAGAFVGMAVTKLLSPWLRPESGPGTHTPPPHQGQRGG